MRKALIDDATGLVENIIAVDDAMDPPFDPGDGKTLMDAGGAEIGGTWDGTQFLPKPPPDPAVIELEKELEATRLLTRAVDETFLDGHWITLKAMAGSGITTGVAAIDDAVSATNRTAFDQFFRDQVKSRL